MNLSRLFLRKLLPLSEDTYDVNDYFPAWKQAIDNLDVFLKNLATRRTSAKGYEYRSICYYLKENARRETTLVLIREIRSYFMNRLKVYFKDLDNTKPETRLVAFPGQIEKYLGTDNNIELRINRTKDFVCIVFIDNGMKNEEDFVEANIQQFEYIGKEFFGLPSYMTSLSELGWKYFPDHIAVKFDNGKWSTGKSNIDVTGHNGRMYKMKNGTVIVIIK